MIEVKFHELNSIGDTLLTFVVIVSEYNGKWIYCKHKERDTWEVPGGHIEADETPLIAAQRELMEESGAIEFELEPISLYSVKSDKETYGLLCYASIKQFAVLPDSEIESISFFEKEPKNLTYPEIQPKLFEKVLQVRRRL